MTSTEESITLNWTGTQTQRLISLLNYGGVDPQKLDEIVEDIQELLISETIVEYEDGEGNVWIGLRGETAQLKKKSTFKGPPWMDSE